MKKNMSAADRIIRMIIAIVLMDMSLDGDLPPAWIIPAWILVALFEMTGLLAWCPFYVVFHIHSDHRKTQHGK